MQRENKNNKVILNLIQNLPRKVVSQRQQQRQTWKIPYQVRDDRPLLNNGNGFTLIELLVVVLIIGILAAVAVPQYQKAVLKARYTQLMAFGNAIEKAAITYHMANGVYPERFDELSIDLPGTGEERTKTYQNYFCELTSPSVTASSYGANCIFTQQNKLLSYRLVYGYKSRCMTTTSWDLGNKICQNLTGKTTPDSFYGEGGSATLQSVYRFN